MTPGAVRAVRDQRRPLVVEGVSRVVGEFNLQVRKRMTYLVMPHGRWAATLVLGRWYQLLKCVLLLAWRHGCACLLFVM